MSSVAKKMQNNVSSCKIDFSALNELQYGTMINGSNLVLLRSHICSKASCLRGGERRAGTFVLFFLSHCLPHLTLMLSAVTTWSSRRNATWLT